MDRASWDAGRKNKDIGTKFNEAEGEAALAKRFRHSVTQPYRAVSYRHTYSRGESNSTTGCEAYKPNCIGESLPALALGGMSSGDGSVEDKYMHVHVAIKVCS